MDRRHLPVLALALLAFSLYATTAAHAEPGSGLGTDSFTFGVAGDFDYHAETFQNIGSSGLSFFQTAGDLSYGGVADWCDLVKSSVGATFPFEIVSGNHDTGDIDGFAACLPDRLSATGTYGTGPYYYDYPLNNPLIRVISGAPGDFPVDQTFVGNAIDDARARGTPWVAWVNHRVCIEPTGNKNCDLRSLFNFLLEKKVDLILEAHAHTYSRSHLLALGPDCPEIVESSFDSDCVISRDREFVKGAGTVVVIQGIGGSSIRDSGWGDPDSDYFAVTMGGPGCTFGQGVPSEPCPSEKFGFAKYNVTENSITEIVDLNDGDTFDGFTIGQAGPPPPLTSTDFTFSPASPTVMQPATFSATLIGGTAPFAFSWDFGDGDSGTGQTATHGYSQAATYTVALTTTDSIGGAAANSHSITIISPEALVADFTFSPSSPVVGQPVTFSGTASGGTPSYSFQWNFGEGTTAAGQTVAHTYSTASAYDVTLLVHDSPGDTASSIKQVTVSQPPPPPPSLLEASFNFTPSNPAEGETVTFSGSASGGTPPYTFSWDFGDASTAYGQTTTHTYAGQRTFTVTLAVTDSQPLTATTSQQITALPPPTPTPTGWPVIAGWGGIRLDEASDGLFARLHALGYSAARVSFESGCTAWKEMGPYRPSLLENAVALAEARDMWLIVDYHGFDDIAVDEQCWLDYWQPILEQFRNRYERIIWEPLNEPVDVTVEQLSSAYQRWITQARNLGDTHWVVVQNLCSFGCSFSNMADGFPTVTDPAARVFISLHSYMDYSTYADSWDSARAREVALGYYAAVVEGGRRTGWPVLNTEGGADPLCSDYCTPDTVLPGSAGYTNTTLEFIQTLTMLYDQDPNGIGWTWWPAGGWTDTPGAGAYGALADNGWGTRLVSSRLNPVPAPPEPPSADLNRDGTVNLQDVVLELIMLGTQNPLGDINRDGRVNLADLVLILSSFG